MGQPRGQTCIKHLQILRYPHHYLRHSRGVMLQFTLFFSFLGLIIPLLMITHPSHIIGPMTTLVFIIASFHPLPQTSMTHLCLLICTVRCKTVAMSNSQPGHKVPCNQLWEFHFALVGTNRIQTLGYNFVPRVM